MGSFLHTGLTSDGDTGREAAVADSEGLAASEGEEPPLLDSKVVVEKVVEEGTQSAAMLPYIYKFKSMCYLNRTSFTSYIG